MARKAVAAAVAFLLLLLAGCGGTVTPEKVQPGQQAPATKAPEKFKVGDAIKMGSLVFTVHGHREVKPQEFLKPGEGKRWVAVEVEVSNQGDKPQAISSLLMFKLADSQGYQYTVSIVPGLKGQLDGEVAPGRKMRGEVGFEIPKEAKGLELLIEPNVLGLGQAIVGLE